MPKENFKLVKIVPGNVGGGRVTVSKDYLKQVGAEPGGYFMTYAGRVRIPENIAKDVGCEQNQNLEANALIYVPITFRRKDLDTVKKK